MRLWHDFRRLTSSDQARDGRAGERVHLADASSRQNLRTEQEAGR